MSETQLNNYDYAGFWKRFAAYFIDILILMPVVYGMDMIVLNIMADSVVDTNSMDEIQAAEVAYSIWSNVLQIVIPLLYFSVMQARNGQTLGKMALKIQVINQEGTVPSFGLFVGRYFAMVLSGLILGIGFLMAAFTKEKVALHDIIVKTYVVSKP